MTRLGIHSLLIAFAFGILAGCDGLWPDAYWRAERYVLLAIDAREQMNLAFDLGNGTASGLVNATVFSIGSDDRYIVVMQHPGGDRSVTNYFFVERTSSSRSEDRENGVRGPLSKEEFEKFSADLSLPTFTKTFDDLK